MVVDRDLRGSLARSTEYWAKVREQAAARIRELEAENARLREPKFCVWEDCDQEPLYCEGHAAEYDPIDDCDCNTEGAAENTRLRAELAKAEKSKGTRKY